MNKVGFIVALKAEASSLKPLGAQLFVLSGAGSKASEKASEKLIDQGVTALISWGCAAALDPKLKPGDLILPSRILSSDGTRFDTNKAWLDAVKQSLTFKYFDADLIESDHIVSLAAEKKQIFDAKKAIALDMESAGVLRIAQKHGIPCIVVRAIVDPASMDLSDCILNSLDETGEIDLFKLIVQMIMHPNELKYLIKLGLNFNRAMNTLKALARTSQKQILQTLA